MKLPPISLLLTIALVTVKIVLLFQEEGSLPGETYLIIPSIAFVFYRTTSILVKALQGAEFLPVILWRRYGAEILSRKEAPLRVYSSLIFFAILDVVLVILMLEPSKI